MSRSLSCIVALWLAATYAAWAAPQDVVFETVPAGANVLRVDGQVLGVSGQPVRLDLPADDNARLALRFELDGYEPYPLTVPVFSIRGVDRYPPPPLPPLKLRPLSTWIALRAWARSHLMALALTAALGLAGLAGLLRHRRALGAAASGLSSATTALPTDRSRTTLGSWVLARRIGRGASSEVYAGFRLDAPDGPEVAIKVLRFADLPENELARARFEREADLLAGLRHPNIIGFVDRGRDGDVLFLVEELAEGRLDIPADGLPPEAFLARFVPVVEAVAHAHAQGIVHRDLKPDNILLDAAGAVKVADFGLAHLDAAGTQRGAGTPLYMAPELLAGRPATPLSDQYALGVMAWQMLCGRPPHEGATVGELMVRRQAAPPPLQCARPVPSHVQRAVERMLAPEPDDRYPDLRTALRDLS